MKKIILETLPPEEKILLGNVGECTPIFAKRNNKLCGMITEEKEKGWILKTGGLSGATGHYPTRKECIESCLPCGYEFYVK